VYLAVQTPSVPVTNSSRAIKKQDAVNKVEKPVQSVYAVIKTMPRCGIIPGNAYKGHLRR
jgi:hypothetical protein